MSPLTLTRHPVNPDESSAPGLRPPRAQLSMMQKVEFHLQDPFPHLTRAANQWIRWTSMDHGVMAYTRGLETKVSVRWAMRPLPKHALGWDPHPHCETLGAPTCSKGHWRTSWSQIEGQTSVQPCGHRSWLVVGGIKWFQVMPRIQWNYSSHQSIGIIFAVGMGNGSCPQQWPLQLGSPSAATGPSQLNSWHRGSTDGFTPLKSKTRPPSWGFHPALRSLGMNRTCPSFLPVTLFHPFLPLWRAL